MKKDWAWQRCDVSPFLIIMYKTKSTLLTLTDSHIFRQSWTDQKHISAHRYEILKNMIITRKHSERRINHQPAPFTDDPDSFMNPGSKLRFINHEKCDLSNTRM